MKARLSILLIAGLAIGAVTYSLHEKAKSAAPIGAPPAEASVFTEDTARAGELVDDAPAHVVEASPAKHDRRSVLGSLLAALLVLGTVRTIRDANLTATKALPAAGATAYTDSIQLGSEAGGAYLERIELELTVETLPSLVDTKTAVFKLQDSADNITFADIPGLASKTLTGAGGAGATGFALAVKLPSDTRPYVRAAATVESGGGSNIAKTMTLAVLG